MCFFWCLIRPKFHAFISHIFPSFLSHYFSFVELLPWFAGLLICVSIFSGMRSRSRRQ
ncbi:unnamed protein product, partial [Vitis vinifera]